MNEIVKLVVYVPEESADKIREVLGKMGAGKLGNYEYSSFSVKGTGRFRPLQGAKPAVGEVGEMSSAFEERIETICYQKEVWKIIEEVKKVHPYEEVAIDVYPLLVQPDEVNE